VEEMQLKKDVFMELDKICKPETIFATNSSSLSITEIAACTSRPTQFIGMHFFNPPTAWLW
jgi:3-hydroxyacyl-CoA dehydrogenase